MKRFILAALLIVIVGLMVVATWHAAPPQTARGHYVTPTEAHYPRDCYCVDPITREIDWCACSGTWRVWNKWRGQSNRWRIWYGVDN